MAIRRTVTLTTGVDTSLATANDTVTGIDTGNATTSTFNTGDVVNAAKAVNVTFTGAGTVAADINNVTTFSGTMLAAGAINAALFDNVTTIQSAGGGLAGALTVTHGAIATTYGVTGETSAGGITVGSLRAADFAGTADTLKMSVSGVGAAGNVATSVANTAVTLSNGQTGVEGVTIATAGTNYFTVSGAGFTTATTDGATFTVTGSGTNTITASALTQVATYDMSTSTGTNALNLAGALTTSDTVKGGTGTDTLRVAQNTTAANLTVTGVEALRMSATTGGNGVTGAMTFATAPSFTSLRVDGDVAETGTNSLTSIGTSAVALSYVGDSVTANASTAQQFNNLTINSSYTGSADTLAVTVGNGGVAQTAAGGYTLRTLSVAGVETMTIAVSDIAAGAQSTFTGITDTTLANLTVTSAGGAVLGTITTAGGAGATGTLAKLDLAGVTGSALSSATLADGVVSATTVINAATGTGGTSITLGAETATDSVIYTGGQGVDTLVGSTFTGVVVADGKAGNDVISGGTAADTLTGGEGTDAISSGVGADSIVLTETTAVADTVVFGNTLTTTAGSNIAFGALGGADTITGFGATDVLMFDVSAFGLTDGTEYVGAIGSANATTDHILIITGGAGYATDVLAEAALDAQINDTDDYVAIYFNTTDNLAHIIHDTTGNTTGVATLVGTFNVAGNVVGGMASLTIANIDSFA